MMRTGGSVSRRTFLAGTVSAAAWGVAGMAGADSWRAPVRRKYVYEAVEGDVDLGGPSVTTWTYGGRLPGKELRLRAGEPIEVVLKNRLPADTTIHWHGLRIANAMDGVPGVTQQPVAPGSQFRYRFNPPDAGTFWLHSHGHLQVDRGLYAPLIVEDPRERGDYDEEWTVVLDDWVDGTGRTPEDVFHHLKHGGHHGGHDGGDYDDPCLGYLGQHVGDVHDYSWYLINGRVPDAPDSFNARPGQRVRLRIINASADTMFRVALAEHTFTVTHTDGFPVHHRSAPSLLLGMAERVDAIVELGDGVFPLVAQPEGKHGLGRALVRTGGGRPPATGARPAQLQACPLLGTDLIGTDDVTLDGPVDRTHDIALTGDMMHYVWKINGAVFGEHTPLPVRSGEGIQLRFENKTMMPHPMHLHGHTFQVIRPDGSPGARKDTAIVPAQQALEVYFIADSPGDWVVHCHNEYHMAAGMMTTIEYQP